MLGLKSLIVEVVSRSVLTSNELLSSFADRYGLPDPTRPGGLERWQGGIGGFSERSHTSPYDSNIGSVAKSAGDIRIQMGSGRSPNLPIDGDHISTTTFVDTFDNSINVPGSAASIALDATKGELRRLNHIAECMNGLRGLTPVSIRNRKWRTHSYQNCWIGREAVEWLIKNRWADNPRQAVVMCTRMMKNHIFAKVSSDAIGIFHNAALFYKFTHQDFQWPLISLHGVDPSENIAHLSPAHQLQQEYQHWLLIEAEYKKINLSKHGGKKIDWIQVILDMVRDNLNKHLKRTQGGNVSVQGAATTVVNSTSGSLSIPSANPNSTALNNSSSSSISSSSLIYSSLPHMGSSSVVESTSSSNNITVINPPVSPANLNSMSDNNHNYLTYQPQDLLTQLRKTHHFQGEELVKYLKRHSLATTTRDAMIVLTYLLLLPKHAPRSMQRNAADAYFYVVGRQEMIQAWPHVSGKIDALAYQEAQKEQELQAAKDQQAALQQEKPQNTTLVNGVLTISDPNVTLALDGSIIPPSDLITAPRKIPLTLPNVTIDPDISPLLSSTTTSSTHNSQLHQAGEILLPPSSKEAQMIFPPRPYYAPGQYHAFLKEHANTLPYDWRLMFKNADVWYRLSLPGTKEKHVQKIPQPSPADVLPGAIPGSPVGPNGQSGNGALVPMLGLSTLPLDTIIDSSSLPSLVRNHWLKNATSVALPSQLGLPAGFANAAAAGAGGMSLSTTPDLQEWSWEFVQSFGDDSSSYDFDDADDLVTAVEFSPTGEYLAIGDKAGRVSIVQEHSARRDSSHMIHQTSTMLSPQLSPPLEYKFYTEFQSHDAEFDCLKSVEIEPKINVIEWWKHTANQTMLLTSNDKTVKLWRLGPKAPVKKSLSEFVQGTLNPDQDTVAPVGPPVLNEDEEDVNAGPNIGAIRKKTFKNAHGYNIHSVSVNSDGQTFFSADDLRINLWDVEREDECYTIVDLKPPELTEVDELITVARFHPHDCSILMHGSSKGVIRLADLREKALVDRAHAAIFAIASPTKKTYFSEITDSILDARFSQDGRYILSRDYLTLRMWDTHHTAEPIHTAQVHPYLQSQFINLLDNESIFDQFQCAMSRDGLHFVSGSYSNSFTLHNVLSRRTVTIKARDDAREPLLINQHYNYDNGTIGSERPLSDGRSPWSGIAPEPKNSDIILPATTPTAAAGLDSPTTPTSATSTSSGNPDDPALHFNQLKPSKEPNYRKKVLKVAWHPQTNAVAVAGLYKLYLYQAKVPTPDI